MFIRRSSRLRIFVRIAIARGRGFFLLVFYPSRDTTLLHFRLLSSFLSSFLLSNALASSPLPYPLFFQRVPATLPLPPSIYAIFPSFRRSRGGGQYFTEETREPYPLTNPLCAISRLKSFQRCSMTDRVLRHPLLETERSSCSASVFPSASARVHYRP